MIVNTLEPTGVVIYGSLPKEIENILAEKNIACDCQHVTDLQQIMAYGVMSLPGLVINDKVVSYGRILSKADIKKALEL